MLVTTVLTPLYDAPLLIRVLLVPHSKGAPVLEWVGNWREVEQDLTLFTSFDILKARAELERHRTVSCRFDVEPNFIEGLQFRRLPSIETEG